MKHVTSQQMKEIDRRSIEEFGIPSIILMENAGRAAAAAAMDMIVPGPGGKVICVCGKGNNGGDGFVCVRHLLNHGVGAEVFLVPGPADLKGEAKINYDILVKMKAEINTFSNSGNFETLEEKLKSSVLIIDALFGIGLSSEIRDPYYSVITAVNKSGKPVLSLDVPSGLDATTGEVLGVCVKADKTVTFALPKTGFTKNKGALNTGGLIVAGISVPGELLE